MNEEREASGFPLIDAHIHLERYTSDERKVLLEESFQGGVKALIAVAMDMNSSEQTRQLALRHPGRILPAYGWHPEQPLPKEGAIKALLAWIRRLHAAGEEFAIGEVGLPYYTRTDAQAAGMSFDESGYRDILGQFAELAAETDRPLVLHAVYEDAAKAVALLQEHGVRRAHFHWYKGNEETNRLLAASGYFISVTPDVLYEEEIQHIAASYPLGLMMTETDGPWPFEGPFAGRRTHPLMMRRSVEEIARLRGLDTVELGHLLAANARRFYGLSE